MSQAVGTLDAEREWRPGAILRNGAGVMSLRVTALILAVALEVVLSRTLGVDAYGVLAAALAWAAVAGSAATLGSHHAVVRFAAAYRAEAQWALLQGLARWSWRVCFAGGCAMGMAVFGLGFCLTSSSLPELAECLFVVAVSVPLWSVLINCQASLQSLGRPVMATTFQQLVVPLLYLALIVWIWISPGEPSPSSAAWAFCVATLGGAALGAAALARSWPAAARGAVPSFERSRWWETSLPMLFVVVANLGISRADPAWLASLATPADAAYYSVASKMSDVAAFGLLAAGFVLAPRFSELHARGDLAGLQRSLRVGAIGACACAAPVVAVLIGWGPVILPVFGAGFASAQSTLVVLSIGQVGNVVVGPVGLLLAMTGHQGVVARALGVSLLAKLLMNVWLIPSFGAFGAAIATAAALWLWNGLLVQAVWRRLGVDPTLASTLR